MRGTKRKTQNETNIAREREREKEGKGLRDSLAHELIAFSLRQFVRAHRIYLFIHLVQFSFVQVAFFFNLIISILAIIIIININIIILI